MPRLGGSVTRGLALSASVALIGARRKALAPSGAIAATLLGTTVYAAGGIRWSTVLLAFFGSSSVLSRRNADGHPQPRDMASRGSRRDHVQAVANGGVAGALALTYIARGDDAFAAAYAGALAAANADTWATEIGASSTRAPRSILTGRTVAPGTSGGVTMRGTIAALAGSATIALTAAASVGSLRNRSAYFAICLGGFVGSIVDSAAGATIQAGYRCPNCQESTERRIHRCGDPTVKVKGWRWCNNDVVNLLCTVTGALAAAGFLRGHTRQQSGPRG